MSLHGSSGTNQDSFSPFAAVLWSHGQVPIAEEWSAADYWSAVPKVGAEPNNDTTALTN